MLIREAINILKSVTFSEAKKVALVCSFEPLHLKTYLQAYLAKRLPGETPEVVSFGYDQLRTGLRMTSSSLGRHPTFLFLSWEDLHPALSWRGRGKRNFIVGEVAREAEQAKRILRGWLTLRAGAETYIILPPLEFLPLLDACPTLALGPATLAASVAMWDIAQTLSAEGGRLLKLPLDDLNYRDLLLSGCPFSAETSERIATQLVDALYPVIPRKKVLVTDLDGTLWQGIIGEEGVGGIACRSEGKGLPFYVFQEFLYKLKNEGVLLAFCSKNNPEDVVPFFDTMDMPLKLSDFAAHRCNWERKSDNIRAIASELNIASDSLVFVDDDESEIAEVQRQLPEVICFRTPYEGQEWKSLFKELQDLFATWRVSQEDRTRTDTFEANRRRAAALEDPRGSGREGETANGLVHLRGMMLEVTIRRDAFHDPRSLELINKTNQFNLTGERFTQEEWLTWAAIPGTFCCSARLKDRFGDFGTVGVVTGRLNGDDTVVIRQFVLSCRAFSRGVETILLAAAVAQSERGGIMGRFKDTGKNEPAKRFLSGLGCSGGSDGTWRLEREAVDCAYRTVIEQTDAKIHAAPAPASKRA